MDDDLKWVSLARGSVSQIRPDESRAVSNFEPVPFEPGIAARDWLRLRVSGECDLLETVLKFRTTGTQTELLGFYAIQDADVYPTERERFALRLRRIRMREPDPQLASMIAWMVRSRTSPSGSGEDLFDHALGHAIELGSVALLVEPHDEATENMWHRHFRFFSVDEKSRGSDKNVRRLWYPVKRPPQDFG